LSLIGLIEQIVEYARGVGSLRIGANQNVNCETAGPVRNLPICRMLPLSGISNGASGFGFSKSHILLIDLDECIAGFCLSAVDEGFEVHKRRAGRLDFCDFQGVLAADYVQVFIERTGGQSFSV